MLRGNRLFLSTISLSLFLLSFIFCLYWYPKNQAQLISRQGVGALLPKATGDPGESKRTDLAEQDRVAAAYAKLPLSFVANEGQADAQVKFYSRGQGYGLFLTPTEAVLALSKVSFKKPDEGAGIKGEDATTKSAFQKPEQTSVLRMKLQGANPRPQVAGLDELPGKVNYFVGSSPDKSHADIATYAKVRYEQVYQGVDLIYYGNQRQFEYDFVVAPGADPRIIRIAFQGTETLALDEQGDLVLKVQQTEIKLRKPFSYQLINGERHEVAGRYVIRKDNELGFTVADYDPSRPLIIDPVLVYSTYLGGSNGNNSIDETANSIAVDAAGNAYVTGTTTSVDFPVVNAYKPTGGGFSDAFVSKLNSSGSALIYSTYLGGNRNDYGNGIAIDSTGAAYVTGISNSTDFPVTPGAYQTTGLDEDVFITKLNAAGNALVYSTLLSGDRHTVGPGNTLSSAEEGFAIAVNAAGEAYVTGKTQSTNFPSANPVQSSLSGSFDLFITKLNANGTGLVFSTYFGGTAEDDGQGIALDRLGNAYVTGTTYSTDFPTTPGAFNNTKGFDGTDAIVAKFSPTGALVYSTYVGGDSYDNARGIATDHNGNAFITGDTISNNFPTTAAALKKRFSKGAVFKSTDGSAQWKTTGLTDQFAVYAVTVDPATSTTIYAGTDGGIYRSTDGGSSWIAAGLANLSVRSIAVDPTNPSKILAGTFGQGIFKSTDGGQSWTHPVLSGNVYALVFNPGGADKVYAGTGSGTLISTDGGNNWSVFRAGSTIKAIVFDPTNLSTIYLCATSGIIKSVDNGANWNFVLQGSSFNSLVIDPQNPSILYAANQNFGVYKTTNAGSSWGTVNNGIPSNQSFALAIDPVNSNTVYVSSSNNGVYKTVNGGGTWSVTGLSYSSVNALLIDPANPSVLYAAASVYQNDAFITELNSTGSALVYSSYLGGTGYDKAFGIAIDSRGNPYLTGVTSSIDFPLVQPLQQINGIATEAFIVKLKNANASVAFSTYLGGRLADQANAIAVDAAGNIYVAGETRSSDFPVASPLQPALNSIFDPFITKISAPATLGGTSAISDFNGDGRTDVSIWQGDSGKWQIINSSDGSMRLQLWGQSSLGDLAVPGDYDGDGHTDISIFRPSEGNWYILRSSDGASTVQNWGGNDDRPVPADYDGDGRTDIAVFRPSESNWYVLQSSGGVMVQNWGDPTDKLVPGDYDGDGRADVAVWRPTDGNWYIRKSTGGLMQRQWGLSQDRPVEGDYDGDGTTDIAVFRPSEGNWYMSLSGGGATVRNWGDSTDRPVPGDYDGDGKTDIAVWRPSEGTWYIIQSGNNAGAQAYLGGITDLPIPSAYLPQ